MQKDAYQRWYQKHRKEFNLRRRQRYQTDPVYRQRVIDATLASRARKAFVDKTEEPDKL